MQNFKLAVRAIIFLLICAILVAVMSFFVIPRGNAKEDGMINPKAHAYLAEPENTLDVVLFGNSDVRYGFIPMELWNATGITSHCVSINWENVFDAYDEFEQVLKTQKPKLVILETDMIFSSDNNRGVVPYENLLKVYVDKLIPVALYHNNWKTILKYGFQWDKLTEWDYTYVGWEKGHAFSKDVVTNEPKEDKQRTRTIRKFNRMQLDKFIEKCDELDIEILFVEFPTLTSWSNAKFKAIDKYAKSKGVTFIDLNQELKGITDWNTDSRDDGDHLNYYGGMKVTKYLIDYISENYDFESHKGDSDYAAWDEFYKKYLHVVENNISEEEEGVGE